MLVSGVKVASIQVSLFLSVLVVPAIKGLLVPAMMAKSCVSLTPVLQMCMHTYSSNMSEVKRALEDGLVQGSWFKVLAHPSYSVSGMQK